jgi:hypothetical protein
MFLTIARRLAACNSQQSLELLKDPSLSLQILSAFILRCPRDNLRGRLVPAKLIIKFVLNRLYASCHRHRFCRHGQFVCKLNENGNPSISRPKDRPNFALGPVTFKSTSLVPAPANGATLRRLDFQSSQFAKPSPV